MKEVIVTSKDRLKYLLDSKLDVVALGDIEGRSDMVRIEVTVKDGLDLLLLFHTGIKYGIDETVRRAIA
jgi:hypothetical protein